MPHESMPEAMKCASPPLKEHMLGSQSASCEVSPPGTPRYSPQPDGRLLPLNSCTYFMLKPDRAVAGLWPEGSAPLWLPVGVAVGMVLAVGVAVGALGAVA